MPVKKAIKKRVTPVAFARCCCLLFLLFLNACVTKTLTITSEPSGAKCYVNDSYKGVTPVTFAYHPNGRYDIRLTKADYQTKTAYVDLKSPWYQIPPIDMGAEFLTTKDIQDKRSVHLTLSPFVLEEEAEVINKAKAMQADYQKLKSNPKK